MAPKSSGASQFWTLGRRVVQESVRDGVPDLAASVAFYFLFSLFPALLFLAALLSQLHLSGLINNIIATLNENLPREAGGLVRREIGELLENHPSGLISLGTILLLYSASQGFTGLMSAFNIAYEVPETRPWWRRILIAVGLTFSAGLLIALALAILLFGQKLLFFIAGPFHMGPVLTLFWPLLHWALIFAFLVLAVALLYRYVPNIARTGTGTLAAACSSLLLWLIASALLETYANNFATYSTIYGSLGAVIALMLWFYVLALALLIGAEIHSELLRSKGIALHPGVPSEPQAPSQPEREAA